MTAILSALVYGGAVAPTTAGFEVAVEQTPNQLDKRYHDVHTQAIQLLRDPASRNFRALARLPFAVFFDPATTSALVSFVALGGLDALCEVLCDDVLFGTVSDDTGLARVARVFLADAVRLLDECTIVSPATGTYLLCNHPRLVARVFAIAPLRRVRDRCLSFMEHIVSFAGPVWRVRNSRRFLGLLFSRRVDDITFCRLARVLSIAVVGQIVAGPGVDAVASDPFPLSEISRRVFCSHSTENCDALLSVGDGAIVRRLFHLLSYSRDTRRRPTSSSSSSSVLRRVDAPEGMAPGAQAFALDVNELQRALSSAGGESSLTDVLQMLMLLQQQGGVGGGANNDALRLLRRIISGGAGAGAGAASAAPARALDDLDEDEDDAGDGDDDDFDDLLDGGGVGGSAADNALVFERFVNDMQAEAQIEDSGTVDDSADMSWLVGDDDPDRLYRGVDLVIDEAAVPPHWTASARGIVAAIQRLAPAPGDSTLADEAEQESTGPAEDLTAKSNLDRKTIVAAHSELLYLVHSLLATFPHRVFDLINRTRAMETLLKLLRWFVVEQHEGAAAPAAAPASPSAPEPPRSGSGGGGGPPAATLPPLVTSHEQILAMDLASLSALFRAQAQRHEQQRRVILERHEQHARGVLMKVLGAWQASLEFTTIGAGAPDDEDGDDDGGGGEARRPAAVAAAAAPALASVGSAPAADPPVAAAASPTDANDDDGAASIASSHEPDRGGHTHNVETLTKIELARVLQELTDGRSIEECYVVSHSHFRQVGTDTDSDGAPVFSASDPRTTAMQVLRLMLQYLETPDANADPCVDNLFCFALEAHLRGIAPAEREPAQRMVLSVVSALFDRLMLRSWRGTAHLRQHAIYSGPLPPLDGSQVGHRRLDAVTTLIADSCRYRPRHWAFFESYLSERAGFSLLRDRLLRCTPSTVLFLRAFFLTEYKDLLACPVLLSTTPAMWVDCARACAGAIVRGAGTAEAEAIERRRAFVLLTEECVETTAAIAERIYRVRRLLAERDLAGMPADDIIALLSSDDINVSTLRPELRHATSLFSNKSGDGTDGVPELDSVGAQCVAAEIARRARRLEAEGSTAGSREMQQCCPLLFQTIHGALPALFARLIAATIVDDIESVDKLSTLVAALTILMGLRRAEGDEAAERLLAAACDHHQLRRKKALRRAAARLRRAEAGRHRNASSAASADKSGGDAEPAAATTMPLSTAALFFAGRYEPAPRRPCRFDRLPADCIAPVEDEEIALVEEFMRRQQQQQQQQSRGGGNCGCTSSSSSDDDDGDDGTSAPLFSDVANPGRKTTSDDSLYCEHCGARRTVNSKVLRVPCAARCFFNALCVWVAHYSRHPRYLRSITFTTQITIASFRETVHWIFPRLQRLMRK